MLPIYHKKAVQDVERTMLKEGHNTLTAKDK